MKTVIPRPIVAVRTPNQVYLQIAGNWDYLAPCSPCMWDREGAAELHNIHQFLLFHPISCTNFETMLNRRRRKARDSIQLNLPVCSKQLARMRASLPSHTSLTSVLLGIFLVQAQWHRDKYLQNCFFSLLLCNSLKNTAWLLAPTPCWL